VITCSPSSSDFINSNPFALVTGQAIPADAIIQIEASEEHTIEELVAIEKIINRKDGVWGSFLKGEGNITGLGWEVVRVPY
jgi:hypothetical protein